MQYRGTWRVTPPMNESMILVECRGRSLSRECIERRNGARTADQTSHIWQLARSGSGLGTWGGVGELDLRIEVGQRSFASSSSKCIFLVASCQHGVSAGVHRHGGKGRLLAHVCVRERKSNKTRSLPVPAALGGFGECRYERKLVRRRW